MKTNEGKESNRRRVTFTHHHRENPDVMAKRRHNAAFMNLTEITREDDAK